MLETSYKIIAGIIAIWFFVGFIGCIVGGLANAIKEIKAKPIDWNIEYKTFALLTIMILIGLALSYLEIGFSSRGMLD